MKKHFLGLGAVGSAAVMALFGTATAAADYVGETYADASETMSEEGVEPIVATRVGDKLEDDDCIVTAAWAPPFVRGVGDGFEHSEGEMLVSLNCAGAYATVTNPGTSTANPLGREAKEQAEEEEEEELAAPATPDE